MRCEIITIGTEILIGQIVDTNSAFMGKALNEIGVEVRYITTIADKWEDMISAFKIAEERADLVLITGGLGPTRDDITKKVLLAHFGGEMIIHHKALENVEQIFNRFGKEISEINRLQAQVPSTCEVIVNKNGTAPCMWFERDGVVFVSMPGVPFEMKPLMTEEIIPRIKATYKLPTILHHTYLTSGKGESEIAAILTAFEDDLPQSLSLAYLPSPGRVRIRLSAIGEKEIISPLFETHKLELKQLLGDLIYGEGEEDIARVLGERLSIHGVKVAVAESCTGGNVAKRFTQNAGSSNYFEGGIVVYTEALKINCLDVSPEIIKKDGVVSESVAEAMVKGLVNRFNVEAGIATTGVAGPVETGDGNPVGTVCISTIFKDRLYTKRYHFGGDRERVIERASVAGFNQLLGSIKRYESKS